MPEDSEFNCPQCDRSFKNDKALRAHMKYNHPIADINDDGITENNASLPVLQDIMDKALEETLSTHEGNDLPVMQTLELQHNDYIPNNSIKVLIKKLDNYHPSWPDVGRAYPGDAGIDLRAAISDKLCIGINKWVMIPSGIKMVIPYGYVALCCPRSGLAANKGITVLNAPGVVDAGFRGELMTILVNNTTSKYWIEPGDKVSQLVIIKLVDLEIENADELPDSVRGIAGYGSSGR